MYGVFLADIKLETFPTCSLRNPIENVYIYQNQGTVHKFETKTMALSFAVDNYRHGRTITLLGEYDPICFYQSIWAGKGETCQQDIDRLTAFITQATVDDIDWSYMKDDLDQLKKATGLMDIDDLEDDDEAAVLTKAEHKKIARGEKIVTAYSMTDGKFLKRMSTMTMFKTKLEWDDLTPEEKAYCTDSETEKTITVSSGCLYEVTLLRKYNGNKVKAWLHGNLAKAKDDFRMLKYRITSNVEGRINDVKYKINEYRIKKGWV